MNIKIPSGYTEEELERDNPYNQWMYEDIEMSNQPNQHPLVSLKEELNKVADNTASPVSVRIEALCDLCLVNQGDIYEQTKCVRRIQELARQFGYQSDIREECDGKETRKD